MEFIKQPMEIENRSMEIIAPHLAGLNLTPEQVKVYSRLIHAAGDVDYAPIIKMSADAIAQAMTALKGGCDIYTDVEMVRTGINKRKLASFGGQVHCLIADEEVAKTAKEQGITRSMAAMRKFGAQMNGAVIAIGNAPTALFEVLRQVADNIDFSLLAVNADGDYAERVAENQTEFEQRMADELAEADAERAEAEAAMAEEVRAVKEELGAWGLDVSLLPGEPVISEYASRLEGALFDAMWDDRVMTGIQLDVDYYIPTDEEGWSLSLYCNRYTTDGRSITGELLGTLVTAIRDLENTERFEKTAVNRMDAYIFEQDYVIAILWYDAAHDILFQLTANHVPDVSDAWLVQLAESVAAQ